MRRFRHGPDVREHRRRARGGQPDRVRHLRLIQAEDVPRRHCRTERTRRARRMNAHRLRLVLAGRLPDPALDFHTLDQRCQDIAPAGTLRLGDRQHCGQRGRERMVRRAPHRLEIEHVHRCAVQRRRRNRIELVAATDRGCLRLAAPLAIVVGEDLDRLFLRARDRDGETVEHEPACCRQRRFAKIGITGLGDFYAKL